MTYIVQMPKDEYMEEKKNEQKREYARKYRKDHAGLKTKCDCGCDVAVLSIAQHKKSKKHINFMSHIDLLETKFINERDNLKFKL